MKHTIQIISILSAAAMTLTACGKSDKNKDSNAAQADKWRIVSVYECADYDNNICFSTQENSRLDFVDMTTLEDSPVCDDPLANIVRVLIALHMARTITLLFTIKGSII